MMLRALINKTIVVAGGLNHEGRVEASETDLDTGSMVAKQEEADTKAILPCIKSRTSNIVWARDTDILVLLIIYFHMMVSCHQLWILKAGTTMQRKYVSVHAIMENLQTEPQLLLAALHVLTRSDLALYIAGHTKETCWVLFLHRNHLSSGLCGDTMLTNHTIQDATLFICKLYCAMNANNSEDRVSMFIKGITVERLSPATDSLSTFTFSSLIISLCCGVRPTFNTQFYLPLKTWDGGYLLPALLPCKFLSKPLLC